MGLKVFRPNDPHHDPATFPRTGRAPDPSFARYAGRAYPQRGDADGHNHEADDTRKDDPRPRRHRTTRESATPRLPPQGRKGTAEC